MKDLLIPLISFFSLLCAYLSYKTSRELKQLQVQTQRCDVIKPCRAYLHRIRNHGSLLLNIQTKIGDVELLKLLPPVCSFTCLPLDLKSSMVSIPPEINRSIRWIHNEINRLDTSFNLRFEQHNVPSETMLICEEQDFLKFLLELMEFCEYVDKKMVYWSVSKKDLFYTSHHHIYMYD